MREGVCSSCPIKIWRDFCLDLREISCENLRENFCCDLWGDFKGVLCGEFLWNLASMDLYEQGSVGNFVQTSVEFCWDYYVNLFGNLCGGFCDNIYEDFCEGISGNFRRDFCEKLSGNLCEYICGAYVKIFEENSVKTLEEFSEKTFLGTCGDWRVNLCGRNRLLLNRKSMWVFCRVIFSLCKPLQGLL